MRKNENRFSIDGVDYVAADAPRHGSGCGLCDLAGTRFCCVGKPGDPDCRRWFRQDGRDVNFVRVKD